MKMNITNCIIIGLISIALVLFLFYENPLLIKKNKEGFETTTTQPEGTTNTTSKGDNNEGVTTTTQPEGTTNTTSKGDNNEGVTTTTQPVDKVNTSLIREFVKTIFSIKKITIGSGTNTVTDAIKKNIILTTKKIKDDSDIIEIYDIEDDDNKMKTITQTTKNDNITDFIKQIRLKGREDNDFTLVNRDKDFFLNMVNGVAIDIKFINNYVRDFTNVIETDTIIKELLPINFEGTEEDRKEYKNYPFKNCNIQVDRVGDTTTTDTITLEFYKETNINANYLKMLNQNINDDKNKCKSIYATQTTIIKIVLNNDYEIKNTTIFKDLIENINVPESEFSYQLGFRYLSNTGSEVIPKKGIYNIRLYLQNVEFKTYSMNDWLTNSINKENENLLNNKLDNIITPMFDLDNEIEKRDKVVKRIHDIYRFNKLSNSQNTLRFYNSHY